MAQVHLRSSTDVINGACLLTIAKVAAVLGIFCHVTKHAKADQQASFGHLQWAACGSHHEADNMPVAGRAARQHALYSEVKRNTIDAQGRLTHVGVSAGSIYRNMWQRYHTDASNAQATKPRQYQSQSCTLLEEAVAAQYGRRLKGCSALLSNHRQKVLCMTWVCKLAWVACKHDYVLALFTLSFSCYASLCMAG